MSTQIKSATASYKYSYTIGTAQQSGERGFLHPVDVAISKEEVLYVINRPGHIPSFGGSFKTIINMVTPNHEYKGQFGDFGDGDGQFYWPASLAFDSQENLYVSDEFLNRISIFSNRGNFLNKWGKEGSSDGELNRPSGIAFDQDDNLYVADAMNHRIQKFTKDGTYLGQWGSFGTEEGQFNMPWGIAIDSREDVYVVDWRNDRIQKFAPDGDFITKFGRSGSGDGEFNRPSHVTVDDEGYVYVSDRYNNRVQIFDTDGNFVTKLLGEAELSPWQLEFLEISPDQREQRAKADLSVEKPFYRPMGLKADQQGRIFIVDTGRIRIQVYLKERKVPA